MSPAVRLSCLFLWVSLAIVFPASAQKHTLLQEDAGLYNVLQGQAGAALNATTLSAACANAASANKMIFLTPGVWTLNANVTCASTRGLLIPKGSSINRNGFLLTIAGPLLDLNNELSDGRNVKDCGAKVDGVTDDTVALNGCLAAYSHVFVPAGTLLHSGTITMNIGNRLSGVWQGPDASTMGSAGAVPVVPGSLLHYTGAGDAVALLMPTIRECQCRIDNLTIYANTGTRGIHFKNTIQVFIDHVDIVGITLPYTTIGFSVAGIHLEQSLNGTDFIGLVYITHSDIRYTGGYGIKIDGGNNLNAIQIAHTQVQGNSLGGIYLGGHALSADVGGNVLQGNGGGAAAGVGYQFHSFYSAGLNFHGNYIEAAAGRTDPLVRFQQGSGITIQGGIIGGGNGNQTCGIHLGEQGSYLTQGVTIQGVNFSAVNAAICVEWVRDLTVRGNTCWFDCTAELGGSFNLVQGFSYQQMTREVLSGQPVSVIESTPTLFCHSSTLTTVANTTTETVAYSCLVPAHTFENTDFIGGVAFVVHGGLENNSPGPVDYTFRVKFGGVTFATHRYLAVASIGGVYPWVMTGDVVGSAAGVNKQTGWFKTELGAQNTQVTTVVDTGVTARFSSLYGGTAGADPTVDQTLQVTVQMSVAHAAAAIFKENGRVLRLPF